MLIAYKGRQGSGHVNPASGEFWCMPEAAAAIAHAPAREACEGETNDILSVREAPPHRVRILPAVWRGGLRFLWQVHTGPGF